MRTEDTLIATLVEDGWLTLEEAAALTAVEPAWLQRHIDEGLFPHARNTEGRWQISSVGVLRARRMRSVERDFDAVPELAALMADLLEEMDSLRRRLRSAGLE